MEWGKDIEKAKKKLIQENDFSKVEEKKFKLMTRNEIPFFIIGFLLIVLIAGFVSVVPMIREQGTGDISGVDEKLKELNGKLAKLKEIEEKINKFEKSVRILKTLDAKIDTVDANLTLRVSKLKESIDEINGKYASIKVKVEKRKKEKQVKETVAKKEIIKNPSVDNYHRVKKGDTFYSISRKYKISLIQLQKLNNFDENSKLYPNMKIRIRE